MIHTTLVILTSPLYILFYILNYCFMAAKYGMEESKEDLKKFLTRTET